MSTVVPEPDKRAAANPGTPQLDAGTAIQSDEPIVVHVSAVAYLRTMWSLLWTAFRHPLTTTYIDAATGEVIDGYEEEK